MTKKILLLLGLIAVSTAAFAYNFDRTVPLKGKSIADTKLQTDTLFSVYSFALRVAEPGCQDFNIVDTKVSKPKANGSWEEIWTVKACTRTANIPVIFTEKEGGITYAVDPMNVKVAK